MDFELADPPTWALHLSLGQDAKVLVLGEGCMGWCLHIIG